MEVFREDGMKTSVTRTANSASARKSTKSTAAKGDASLTRTTAAVAKQARGGVKSQVQSAPRQRTSGTAAQTGGQTPAPQTVPSPGKRAGARSSRKAFGSAMTDSNMPVAAADTIQQPAVSKASEVATKTTKPTSAVPADGALLTEEQILQMSEKDYMNEAQLAFFKARLQQLERDLLKNAGETTEHLRETVVVPDPADRATIEEEHALELRTRDRERKLLKKVQQALASIETGEYGWCEETGEPIGIPRLLARPTATLSLEAQQRRELKQKLYGD